MTDAKNTCYPLTFQPVYQDYIWGGRKLSSHFNRTLPGPLIAESWEVTDRPDGMSVVDQGPAEGTSLHDLIQQMGSDLLGTHVSASNFPLLIKILDANHVLSVQVHPNDETAAQFGGEAKTEMWYVLDAEPDAKVYCGLTPGTTEDDVTTAIKNHTLEDLLTTLPVKKGDAIFVPGGRVHAIAAGCLLLEVQQNSNTTYRMFDWGRMGTDGQPRELHVEKSLEVIEWKDTDSAMLTAQEREPGIEEIISCTYFCMERITLTNRREFPNNGRSFHALFAVDGDIFVNGQTIKRGRTVLLPAALASYTLRTPQSSTEVIRMYIPA